MVVSSTIARAAVAAAVTSDGVDAKDGGEGAGDRDGNHTIPFDHSLFLLLAFWNGIYLLLCLRLDYLLLLSK